MELIGRGNEMPKGEKGIDDLVRTIQTIALFVGLGDGHVSEEEIEYLDEEAPGYIRYCLEARPAFEAFLAGEDAEEISALLPKSVNYEVPLGSLFGGPPAWVEEALEALRSSSDALKYVMRFAAALTDPWDQIVAHYFALKMLTFSREPDQGEIRAYLLIMAVWAGGEMDMELVERLQVTAKDLLPFLLGLEPIDLEDMTSLEDGVDTDEDDKQTSR